MKTHHFTSLILLLISITSSAQEEKIHQEKMKVFEHWAGEWNGTGWMKMGS